MNPYQERCVAQALRPKSDPGNYGWTSIDVNWGGSKFRFVNTCLDIPIFPVTQAFQAAAHLRPDDEEAQAMLREILANTGHASGAVSNGDRQ